MKQLISSKYPAHHLLNPAKAYVPAAQTDIRATFARIQAEQQKAQPKKVRRVK